MAKRSEFAQKLLDDLRVRKERMSASQSSKSSKPNGGDAYTHSRAAYDGSKEMLTHQTAGFRSTQNRTHRGHKSLSVGDAANEIVPFGKGQNSRQIGDLSMALAFALENGGKLRRVDSSGNSSMLSFLNQIGRGSGDMSKMARNTLDRSGSSTNSFPALSDFHVKEISKGAQKLNQILRACSNGLNFDGYSIEIGKELLKGAMDLEESLRMLVNMQEASEYMTNQSKTRITLLEDDEDEGDHTMIVADNKQLARPIFSFDKHSRNSHYIQDAARSDLKKRLMAPNKHSEFTYSSRDAHNLSGSDSASHRRYSSYGLNINNLAAFSEEKNGSSSSISKPEIGRIPNVIARLMGLQELPENNNDSKNPTVKESSSREKMEGRSKKKIAEGSSTPVRKEKDIGNVASPIRKHKQIQNHPIQETQYDTYGLQAERNLASHQASYEGSFHDRKLHHNNVEGTKSMRSSNKTNMKIDHHQGNRYQSSQIMGSRKDIPEKERKHDNVKLKELKAKEKGETEELLLNDQQQRATQQKQNRSEALMTLKGHEESNSATVKAERRNAHNLSSNNQAKSLNNFAFQQQQMLQSSELQKQHAGESEQQSVKQKIQVRRPVGNESRSSPKPAYDSTNFPQKRSHKNKPTLSNECCTKDIGIMQKPETPRKIDELVARRSGNPQNLSRTLKHQTSILQEAKQRRPGKLGRSKEEEQVRSSRSTETCILKSDRSIPSIPQANVLEELQSRAEKASNSSSLPLDDECCSRKVQQISTFNQNSSQMVNNQQAQEHDFRKDNLSSHSRILPLDRIHEEKSNHKKISTLETIEPLTESENHLKQILLKSQLFLNTAEALFKLNIPFDILNAKGGQDHPDEESKLLLDCGYEVMKRKGKRKDLSVHPFVKINITCLMVRSLDNLIKELHNDLEKLKFYGRNHNAEPIVEDYLVKMLENDIYDKDPDVNCMWDFGWHEKKVICIEKDDVIRDVEKHLLNGLLDEVTIDLLLVFSSN
ncbi:uncharacterized protein LOC126688271 [Mercurialis annua]|uniref:uncharacterized protein LOC126688271 n=1 Tax=Mercurialis annua TaxID=3986 RepID=UPI00215F10E5|nr:uncharacterized protein LOC126688271 [Mercurialis annua]